MKQLLLYVLLLATAIHLKVGNSAESRVTEPGARSAKPERNIDARIYTQGQRLYRQHCAQCHGKHAEGDANWRQRDAEGAFPPPPLNGTGHTWHHPKHVLVEIIKNGTAASGGKMPAWKDKLSDAEIHAILSWISAQWPDEIYQAWYTNQQQTN